MILPRALLPIAAVVAVVAVPGQAQAACQLTARTLTPAAQRSYDPFSANPELLLVSVEVSNRGDGACPVRLFARPSTGGTSLLSGGDQLLYRLDSGGSGGTGGAQAGEFGPFTATIGAGQTRAIDVRLLLPAQQIVPRGLYQSDLALRLLDDMGAEVPLAAANVALRAAVPARVEMNVSGAAGAGAGGPSVMAPASINFGTVHGGEGAHVFVNIWSNGSVDIALSSENRGVLRHVDNPALPPIAYRTRFAGEAIDLAAPVHLTRAPPARLAGGSYTLSVTLGDILNNFAGQYRDVITIDVTEN